MSEVVKDKGSEASELTGYARAVAVADKLRQTAPTHELLRLVARGSPEDMDRWDKERLERFYEPPYADEDLTPHGKVEEKAFNALADAMERARQDVPTAEIERVRVLLDPAVDVFNVTLEQASPPGIWMHTAPSEEHLRCFFEGARAMAGLMGHSFHAPSLPSDWRRKIARLEPEPVPEPVVDRNFPF